MVAENFNVGSMVEYSCDEGHLLVGPPSRLCLPTGFYNEFPPVCKRKCSSFRYEYLVILIINFVYVNFLFGNIHDVKRTQRPELCPPFWLWDIHLLFSVLPLLSVVRRRTRETLEMGEIEPEPLHQLMKFFLYQQVFNADCPPIFPTEALLSSMAPSATSVKSCTSVMKDTRSQEDLISRVIWMRDGMDLRQDVKVIRQKCFF